ncbi:hypothetical protein ACFL0H_05870 [Thermodesulfobacteriota bacterium]
MNNSASPPSLSRRIYKWLLWLFCSLLILILLIGATLLLLPGLISTEWFKNRLEQQVSLFAQRRVHVEHLNWTWSRGILIKGLRVDDDPTFSDEPMIGIESIFLATDLRRLFSRCFVINLELKGLDLRLVRNIDGLTNLEFLLGRLKRHKKSAPEPGQKGLSNFYAAIPIDIQGRVQLCDMSIRMQDRIRDQHFIAHDVSFLLEVPSVLNEPITMRLSMEEEIDGMPLPPVNVFASITSLIRPETLLSPDNATLKIKGSVPGVSIELKGEGRSMDLSGSARLDLAMLVTAAQPFFASMLPGASGKIELNVEASGRSGEEINFAVRATGKDLVGTGGPMKIDKIGPVNFSAAHEGTLNIPKAILEIKAGEVEVEDDIRLSWSGTVNHIKDSGPVWDLSVKSLYLDMEGLYDLFEGLVPAGLNMPVIFGGITLKADISGNPQQKINFATTVRGTDLVASGGTLIANKLGPLNFAAIHEGAFDLTKGSLDIKSGEIRLQDKTRVLWIGTLNNLKDFDPVADLIIGPVTLDLKELYAFAEGFIPEGFSIYPWGGVGPGAVQQGGADGSFSGFRVNKLGIKGPVISGHTRVELEGLSLSLPRVKVNAVAASLSGEEINFQVQKAELFFESAFPTKVDFLAGMDIRNVHAKAGEEILLKRLSIPLLNLSATDITVSPKALFGVSARIMLNESVLLKGVIVKSRVRLPELNHSLKAEFVLDKTCSATVNVRNCTVSAPSVSIDGISQPDLETGIDLEAEIAGLCLQGLQPLRVDVERARTRLEIGKLLRASMDARARDLGSEMLDLRGEIDLNLQNLASLVPAGFMSKADLEGEIEVGWEFLGRLPQKEEIDRLTRGDIPLPQRLRQTGFVEKLEVVTSLDNVGTELTFKDNSSLKVSRIRSTTPLKFVIEDSLKKGRVEGEIVFGRIEALPSLGRLNQPVQASITLSCVQEDLRTVNLSETMHIHPINLHQSARLSMDNVDQFFINGLKSPLPVIMEKLEGFATGEVRSDLGPELNRYLKGLSLKGQVEAGAEIYLTGGEDVKVNTWLKSPGLDARLGSGVLVRNMQSHINLEKRYALTRSGDSDHVEKPGLNSLSTQVLNPEKGSQAFNGLRDSTARRIMDDLRGRLAPQPSLSIESTDIRVGPLPIRIYNQELEFRLVRGLPNIDYFQMDLMGGTVVGSMSISKNEKDFVLETSCSLSGLNANSLLPVGIEEVPDEEAELSGQLSLRLPLYTNVRQVLRDIRAHVDLTHIGARTLERFLYAMDPYESNEAIVRQRSLLRIGTPRWISLNIEHGNLSLFGQVEAKGITVDLPRIDRFSLTGLPALRQFEKGLSGLGAVIKLLQAVSADSIYLDNDGIIRFNSP